jgi:pimeloyl-ACP methyl ester carboxylesterase
MTPLQRFSGLLATVLLVAGCSTGSASPSPIASRSPLADVVWETCPESDPFTGGSPELVCATLPVPLDYANPGGPTIDIAIAMLPAADQEGRVGSLFLNFGGPGASGINVLASNGRGLVPAEIGNRFDLVTWDPRGTGRSAPVNCLTNRELDAWIYEPGIPDVPRAADWVAAKDDAIWFARKCAARSGDLLPYIGTSASARDMESMRIAMGLTKLDYLGFSYGTLLGAVYATLYPTSVGHLVLDGAVDPVPTDASEYGEQGVSIQGALDRLFAWCDADAQCPFGNGAARAAFDRLTAAAEKNPIALDDGRTLSAGMIWTGVIMTLYNRDYWEYAVAGLGSAAKERDGELLAALADAYVDRNQGGGYASNIMEAFLAINCIDYPTSASIDKYRAIYEQFKNDAPDFAAGQAASGLLCGVWPARNADPLPESINGAGAPPILVVGTTGDPATPYAWSERLAARLEQGRLLSFVGEGHTGVGGKSTCIDDAAIAFLISGTLPPDGTRCE